MGYACGITPVRRRLPYGNLVVDILGSAVMGLVIGTFAARHVESAHLRLFVTTRLLGGFITFSSFQFYAQTLWERGHPLAAVGYVVASPAVSMVFLSEIIIASRHWG